MKYIGVILLGVLATSAVFGDCRTRYGRRHSITIQNSSSQDARASIGYYRGGEWVSQGWMPVPAWSSSLVMRDVPGEAYGYAYDPASDGFWPYQGDKTFCIDPYVSGVVYESRCQFAAHAARWVSFRRFRFLNECGNHTWTLTNR